MEKYTNIQKNETRTSFPLSFGTTFLKKFVFLIRVRWVDILYHNVL